MTSPTIDPILDLVKTVADGSMASDKAIFELIQALIDRVDTMQERINVMSEMLLMMSEEKK